MLFRLVFLWESHHNGMSFHSAIIMRNTEGVIPSISSSFMFSSVVMSKPASVVNSHLVGAQLSGVPNGSFIFSLGIRLIDEGKEK